MLVQMDLFRGHRLGFDDILDTLFFAEIRNVVLRLLRAVCSENLGAAGLGRLFELVGKLVKTSGGIALYLCYPVPQYFEIDACVSRGASGRVIPPVKDAGEVVVLKGLLNGFREFLIHVFMPPNSSTH